MMFENWYFAKKEKQQKKKQKQKNAINAIRQRPNRENSTLRVPREEILVDGSPPA